jgi:hypothetical protein
MLGVFTVVSKYLQISIFYSYRPSVCSLLFRCVVIKLSSTVVEFEGSALRRPPNAPWLVLDAHKNRSAQPVNRVLDLLRTGETSLRNEEVLVQPGVLLATYLKLRNHAHVLI